ncbi:MAG: hypothetical protein RBT49_02025 [Bacteroidales bacterium]|jgi:hypothetical protein|nr:hypothetical protein [Bacteroidales bacterium]
MENLWTKPELEIFLQYQRLINFTFDCIWIDLEEEDRRNALDALFNHMIEINKPVKVYINSEYAKTVNFSIIPSIEQEITQKLISWVPVNFKDGNDMLTYLEKQIKKELELN